MSNFIPLLVPVSLALLISILYFFCYVENSIKDKPPRILPLGVYPKEVKVGTSRDICISYFYSRIIGNPLTSEWMVEHYSALKKERNSATYYAVI
jgi:hypothetical protein